MLLILISHTQSVPSSIIDPSGRDWLVVPAFVIPSFSFEMLHTLFDLSPSSEDSLLLIVSKVSFVVLDIGNTEPLGPPLTDWCAFKLPVVWWWPLSWVILQLTCSVDNMIVSKTEENRKESDSDEVKVTHILNSVDNQLSWTFTKDSGVGASDSGNEAS